MNPAYFVPARARPCKGSSVLRQFAPLERKMWSTTLAGGAYFNGARSAAFDERSQPHVKLSFVVRLHRSGVHFLK